MENENFISFGPAARTRLPTKFGEFEIFLYQDPANGKEHLALVRGKIENKKPVLVRVHSECITGDVFGSLRCDCGMQLKTSMQMICKEACGVIIYLRQEGRGIGLVEKLKAYNLQDQGYDTVEANIMLGHKADEREYDIAGKILNSLGVNSIRLLSNNPNKIVAMENANIIVVEQIKLQPQVNSENVKYLRTKIQKFRHSFELEETGIKKE